MNAAQLDERAEEVVARARGQLVPTCHGDILFALEDDPVQSVPRKPAIVLLEALGLSGTIREIDSGRAIRAASWFPIVIILGGHARLTWIQTHVLSPGGVA